MAIYSHSLDFIPPVIAHRGASAYAPENTMIAFTKAFQLGVKWIEFDVMLAACHTPIIFHDETLDRTTNGRGLLHLYSYHYLQSLDAGSWFHPIYAGERIPSLETIITFLNQTKMNANVELKPFPGQEKQLVDAVLKLMTPYLKSNLLFSSFSFETLVYLRNLAPDVNIGLLLHEWESGWETMCDSLQCASVHINEEIITDQKVKQIKAMGKKVLCYTVNDPHRAKQLFSYGVDAVFSDMPLAVIL